MRQLLIPAALAAAFLIAAGPPQASAQVVVQYGTPSYGYTPYYGGYSSSYYQPYYQPYYGSYYQPSYGGSVSIGRGGLSFSYGSTPYYGSYYGSPSYYGNRGWYGGGWQGGYRGGWRGGCVADRACEGTAG